MFKDFENDLMINLHKENMRRSTSQMETKQSQSSIINERKYIDTPKKQHHSQLNSISKIKKSKKININKRGHS